MIDIFELKNNLKHNCLILYFSCFVYAFITHGFVWFITCFITTEPILQSNDITMHRNSNLIKYNLFVIFVIKLRIKIKWQNYIIVMFICIFTFLFKINNIFSYLIYIDIYPTWYVSFMYWYINQNYIKKLYQNISRLRMKFSCWLPFQHQCWFYLPLKQHIHLCLLLSEFLLYLLVLVHLELWKCHIR